MLKWLAERHEPVKPVKVSNEAYSKDLKNTERTLQLAAIGISLLTVVGLVINNYGQQIQLFVRTLGLGK